MAVQISGNKVIYPVPREEVQGLIWKAGEWIRQDADPEKPIRIASIARGGNLFGFYLSKIVGAKLFSIPISSYEHTGDGIVGKQTKKPSIDPDDIPLSLQVGGDNIYVTEDLIDTGDTMELVGEDLPDAKRMALLSKQGEERTNRLLHFCGRVINLDVLISEGEITQEQIDQIREEHDGQIDFWLRFYYDTDIQQRFPNAPI